MTKNRKLFGMILVIALAVGIGIFSYSRTEEISDAKLPVTATFYPVAFLAEEIGGDFVRVKTVVPPGIEAHDFDPSLRDIADIYSSRLFLMSGAGIDHFAGDLTSELVKKGVKTVILSETIELLPATEHGEGPASKDPHFWLDPVAYGKSAESILNALVEIDPAHASVYRLNFDRLKRNLKTVDDHYLAISPDRCGQGTVVVSHNAFSYMAKRYGFGVRSLAGINPEEEVSAGELAGILDEMRAKHIRFVLTEPFGDRSAADIVARESGAEVLILNPIEGLRESERLAGKNYYTEMNANWITLQKALECK